MPIIERYSGYGKYRILKEIIYLLKKEYKLIYFENNKIIVKKEDYIFEINITEQYPFICPDFYFYQSIYQKKKYLETLYQKGILLYESYHEIKNRIEDEIEDEEKINFIKIIEYCKIHKIENNEDNIFISSYEETFMKISYYSSCCLYIYIDEIMIILKKFYYNKNDDYKIIRYLDWE
jgi:hypothetical protein